MKFILTLLLGLIGLPFLFSCNSGTTGDNGKGIAASAGNDLSPSGGQGPGYLKFLDTCPDSLVMLNKDSSVFAVINYSSDIIRVGNMTFKIHRDGGIDTAVFKYFNPVVFYPEYGLIHFQCAGISQNLYAVVIDTLNDVRKYIKAGSPCIKYFTLEQYVASAYVSPKNKRIYRDSSGSSVSCNTGSNFYRVLAVKGDWLNVTCMDECGCNDPGNRNNRNGWIKWRDGNVLMVDLAWLC